MTRRPRSYFALAAAAAASIATSPAPTWILYATPVAGPSFDLDDRHAHGIMTVHVTASPEAFPSDGSGVLGLDVTVTDSGNDKVSVTLVPPVGAAQTYDVPFVADLSAGGYIGIVSFDGLALPCDAQKHTCAGDFVVDIALLGAGTARVSANTVQGAITSPRHEYAPATATLEVTVAPAP